jgi:chemotaxis receptor (MCP) glutamine deamidase CheD
MDHTPTEIIVPVDSFQIAGHDQLLCARLNGSFALCISDELEEAGALIHVQAGRPGRAGATPDLTDNTLSTDLLLLDRCLQELRDTEPRARHWQARFVAHADPASGGYDRITALQAFVEVYLEDAGVQLTSAAMHDGPVRQLVFRPALRQLRCEAESVDTTQRMTLLP